MEFSDQQEIRLCEIAEKIFWEGVETGGGIYVENADDLRDLNNTVYGQGKSLVQYLKDIRIATDEVKKQKKA